jgi:hypothetical protein
VDTIDDMIALGDAYIERLEAVRPNPTPIEPIEMVAREYTPEQLRTIGFSMDEVVLVFDTNVYQHYAGYWAQFKVWIDEIGSLEEGELGTYTDTVEGPSGESEDVFRLHVLFEMEDDQVSFELYTHEQRNNGSEYTTMGLVMTMEEVDGVVQAAYRIEYDTATVMETSRRTWLSTFMEDGRLWAQEIRHDGIQNTTTHYFDPTAFVFYEHSHVPDNNDRYRVYDPDHDRLIQTWIPVGEAPSGFHVRWFDDGYPLLRLDIVPSLDVVYTEVQWGLVACSGWSTFDYDGADALSSHPWQSSDWRLANQDGFVSMNRSGENIEELDGWINAGHDVLQCDGVLVDDIEALLASIDVAFFQTMEESYALAELDRARALSVDENHYPE